MRKKLKVEYKNSIMKKVYRVFFLCLVSVVLFNVLTVSSTVILHETSHFFTGVFFQCEEIKIVLIDYPNFSTYTEAKCEPETPPYFLVLAPLLFVTLFGFSFLSLKHKPEKNLSWLIVGFNTIISISDLHFLPVLVNYSITILGIGFIIIGQVKFINQLILFYMKRRVRRKK
jgi:hypothetical protein